ncbi:MAG: hypothetical protein ACD_5C00079G0007 [uncultured bacterium]|nr:MAG: hypothetical protein ACD_5C00079G0007 [uncultured bacterium]
MNYIEDLNNFKNPKSKTLISNKWTKAKCQNFWILSDLDFI